MKPFMTVLLAAGAALALSACAYDGNGYYRDGNPGYADSNYSVYYDGHYGPYTSGFWDP